MLRVIVILAAVFLSGSSFARSVALVSKYRAICPQGKTLVDTRVVTAIGRVGSGSSIGIREDAIAVLRANWTKQKAALSIQCQNQGAEFVSAESFYSDFCESLPGNPFGYNVVHECRWQVDVACCQ